MSIQIGTNFDLKSKQFLDSRQGLPETKEDLFGWNIPVPPGFEICLNEEWYYYDPNIIFPETGHWIPRLVGKDELEGEGDIVNGENRGVTADAVKKIIEERLEDIQGQINDQENVNNPIGISGLWFGENKTQSAPMNVEVGTTIYFPKNGVPNDPNPELQGVITYNLKREKTSDLLINGGKFYIPESSYCIEDLEGNTTLNKKWRVEVQYEGQTYSKDAYIYWKWYAYWGVYLNDPTLIPEPNSTTGERPTLQHDYLSMSGSKTAIESTSYSLTKIFDCSDGLDSPGVDLSGRHRHPFFLIPSRFYTSQPRIKVQGLSYSDITVKRVMFETDSGLLSKYNAIFINQTQTGDNIEISIG